MKKHPNVSLKKLTNQLKKNISICQCQVRSQETKKSKSSVNEDVSLKKILSSSIQHFQPEP